jgi:hypothetical protein
MTARRLFLRRIFLSAHTRSALGARLCWFQQLCDFFLVFFNIISGARSLFSPSSSSSERAGVQATSKSATHMPENPR